MHETAEVRSIEGITASAAGVGGGRFAVVRDGGVSVLDGALHWGGIDLVVVSEREYIGLEGMTGSLVDFRVASVVMAGGVVVLESPYAVVVGETVGGCGPRGWGCDGCHR